MEPMAAIYEAAAEYIRQDTGTFERVTAFRHDLLDTSEDGLTLTFDVDVTIEGDGDIYTVPIVATVGTWATIEAPELEPWPDDEDEEDTEPDPIDDRQAKLWPEGDQ